MKPEQFRVMYWLLLLAAVIALSVVAIETMWSQQWVAWTRNAYPMAEAGVWKGVDAFLAIASFHFIEYYGRTIATMVLISSCFLLSLYIFFKKFWGSYSA